MAYTINRSDGTAIVTVSDGQIDQNATDITLIGKNFSGFGEYLNENFVKILENFANQSQPNQPLTGQIWYDVTEARIKVYTGNEWKAVGTSALASSRPLDLSTGDFWFNVADRQLFFYDGTSDYLIGPDFAIGQGQSGTVVETIEDSSRVSRTITTIYNAGQRVGFYSNSEFTPRIAIPNFDQGVVRIGFNPINQNIKFLGIASNAESLGGVSSVQYAKTNTTNVFSQGQTVQAREGIRWGDLPQGQLSVENLGDIVVKNLASERSIYFRGTKQNVNLTFAEFRVGTVGDDKIVLFTPATASTSTVEVNGDLNITGDLVIGGNTTTITSQIITIKDKTLELAVPDSGSPTDANAANGGIILKGTTDHSILWDANNGIWNSTEDFNVPTGGAYYIGGNRVLYDTGLGFELSAAVTSAPGLTSFGNQNRLVADNITINNNRIANNGVAGPYPDGDPGNPSNLEIEPRGNLILVGTTPPKVYGAGTTNDTGVDHTVEGVDNLTTTELSELTNKKYVANFVRTRSIPLTMDITGYYPDEEQPMTAGQIATELLRICPPAEYESGTKIRLSTVRYFLSNISTVNPSLTTTTLYDVQGSETPGGGQITTGVIREVTANQIGAQNPPRLYPIRGVMTFELNSTKDAWVIAAGGNLVEDQTDPTNPITGIGNFIRPTP